MMEAAGGKNLWIVGGGDLAGQFCDHGLLDELFVQIGSVTLGTGKPLLPRAITSPPRSGPGSRKPPAAAVPPRASSRRRRAGYSRYAYAGSVRNSGNSSASATRSNTSRVSRGRPFRHTSSPTSSRMRRISSSSTSRTRSRLTLP